MFYYLLSSVSRETIKHSQAAAWNEGKGRRDTFLLALSGNKFNSIPKSEFGNEDVERCYFI